MRGTLVLALLASVYWVEPVGAQGLPLKRVEADAGPYGCPTPSDVREPADEESRQAEALGSSASQALILGDTERARDLLARATQLDPTSPELAYQYGRALESLNDARGALAQYCHMLALDPESRVADDVRGRIGALAQGGRATVGPDAVERLDVGVEHADAGRLTDALLAFRAAADLAPAWPDPIYNQGVVLLRLGRRNEAADALSRYVEMNPAGPDAIAVSQRLGQLQAPLSTPSPGGALALGLLVPGMGQFYSGRPAMGFSVLALAGGAAAAGWLIEEIEVRCRVSIPPGGECPSEAVQGRTTERPYLVHGLAAAGAITLIGAVEAWVGARGRRSAERAGLASLDLGGARLSAFAVEARGGSLDLDWVRVTF